jgi:hypothetical protein
MKLVFNNITANSLDVWNISMPINGEVNLEAQVEHLRLHEKKSKGVANIIYHVGL